jgi:hypothetical protein
MASGGLSANAARAFASLRTPFVAGTRVHAAVFAAKSVAPEQSHTLKRGLV